MALTAIASDESRGNHFLICSDERHIVRLIEVNLARAGHTVLTSFRAEEAIELLEIAEVLDQPTPDKIFLFGGMPDAYLILAFVRTHESTERAWVGVFVRSDSERDLWTDRPHRPDEIFSAPSSPTSLFR